MEDSSRLGEMKLDAMVEETPLDVLSLAAACMLQYSETEETGIMLTFSFISTELYFIFQINVNYK